MKLQWEDVVGIIVGLAPIAAISIVFWNNDLKCTLYLKYSITIANSISLFLTISD